MFLRVVWEAGVKLEFWHDLPPPAPFSIFDFLWLVLSLFYFWLSNFAEVITKLSWKTVISHYVKPLRTNVPIFWLLETQKTLRFILRGFQEMKSLKASSKWIKWIKMSFRTLTTNYSSNASKKLLVDLPPTFAPTFYLNNCQPAPQKIKHYWKKHHSFQFIETLQIFMI